MKYCTKCVYPQVSPVSFDFDDNGVCSGCRASNQKQHIDWDHRKQLLYDFMKERSTSSSDYDCIIPVSGGKDSYYQCHVVVKELGFKPLLVTYHGNNYSDEAQHNLDKMREVFNVDHIVFRPSVEILKYLNRAAFYKMGDMNWHAHVGIYTYPAIVACRYRIPTIIWGEHGRTEVGGMYSLNDFVEMTSKYVLEHASRGYTYKDFIGVDSLFTEKDFAWLRYPSDDELFELDLRGIHLNNFVRWDPVANTKLMIERYGWLTSKVGFDRTYRIISNLDDIHENGVHDYLKFVKFGYGRCTDHASKDIRLGLMSRDEAIKKVRIYDHVVPSDLKRWLEYVDMDIDEWNLVCDTFRDPRVWWISDNHWHKMNVWGEPASYGPVNNSSIFEKFKSMGLVF